LKQSGVHVAFTGGTGVLVFLDLVAWLIRENVASTARKGFKFILFVSYPTVHDAIARSLCQGL